MLNERVFMIAALVISFVFYLELRARNLSYESVWWKKQCSDMYITLCLTINIRTPKLFLCSF